MRKNWPMKRFLTVIMSKVNADDKKDLLPSSQCNDNNDDFSNNVQPSSSHNVGKDFHNILFLMFLYLLQGVPIGLTGSLPFILSSRKVSYADQGTFSFAFWPFSMKLLWAPIVDSVFFKSIGRRKSWLIPVQYLIGIFMLVFSNYVHRILESDDPNVNTHQDIFILTAIFFLFTFLSATQDIAVDGWGLTILSKENLGWASICNNAGATTGVLIGNSLFLVLESSDFCNEYIRPIFRLESQNQGLITLKEFMRFFGVVYIVSTTLILFFKKEKTLTYEKYLDNNLSIKTTFKSLLDVLKLKPIQKLIIILLTCKIAFATHSIRSLKMIEAGVPKEKLGLMNAPFQIVQILTPILIGNIANTNRPLDLFVTIYPVRIVMTIILAVWVYMTPLFKDSDNNYPISFFLIYAVINGIYSLIFSTLSLTKAFFFTQISDKKIGGTYMTLLNTISNIGVNYPATLALYLIDLFSFKQCSFEPLTDSQILTTSKKKGFISFLKSIHKNTCSTSQESENCYKYGAKCLLAIDAFYFLTALCIVFGVVWLYRNKKSMYDLQSLPKSAWKINSWKNNLKPSLSIPVPEYI